MDNLSNELNKLKIDRSERTDPPRTSRALILVVLVLIAVAAIVAYALMREPAVAATVDVIKPRVESASESAVLVATGYVIAHHKTQVGAKIMGRVAWIGVEKGDRVRRGQVVVRLEDREYRAQHEQMRAAYEAAQARLAELERGSRPEEVDRAKAELERAEAQLRTDEAQLRRIESLVRQGVTAAQSLDEARGRYDSSRATVAALSKTYELIRQGPRREQIDTARSEMQQAKAAMDYARIILDSTEIRVPIDGTILERNVEQGEMVTTSFVGDRGAKSFVVTLADLNDIQVELDITQNDFNRIHSNQPCIAVTDAYPDREYKCVVDEISPEANRQKATVQVKVKLLEPDEFIRPEMNARVTFLEPESQSKRDADESQFHIVPKRAILDREGGKSVFVVTDGIVQVKPVTVQKEVGADVFISAGLLGTEFIIVGEQLSQLKAGDRVAVRQ